MTAHSISILSELKMTSFGPYTILALYKFICMYVCMYVCSGIINCTLLKPMSNVHYSTSWTRDWYMRCWTRHYI